MSANPSQRFATQNSCSSSQIARKLPSQVHSHVRLARKRVFAREQASFSRKGMELLNTLNGWGRSLFAWGAGAHPEGRPSPDQAGVCQVGEGRRYADSPR